MSARGWWIALAAAAVSLAAGAALSAAALPVKSGHYSGRTSQHRPLTFHSKANRRALKGLTIGPEQQRAGGIKIYCSEENRSDYIDTRVSVEGIIPVASTGRFTVHAHVRGRLQEGDFEMRGRFVTSRRARGTLRLDSTRYSDHATCSSGRLTFTARER
jgi:hypothetical protein